MANDYRARYDDFLVRYFKFIVIALALFSFVLFFAYFSDDLGIGHLLYSICCSYTLGFALMGVPSILFRRTSLVRRWKIVLALLVVALVSSVSLWFVFKDSDTSPNYFITGFVKVIIWYVDEVSLYTVIGGVCMLVICVSLATYGVLEVMSAMLGRNYHRVLLSLQGPDGKLKGIASNLFSVPKIIDVDEVVIRPRKIDGLDLGVMKVIGRYVFLVGVVVASYLFLNPVFLKSIPLQDMMLIVFLLSLFVCTLVIPVSLTQTLGAKALSKGNRPHSMWRGMRDRMFRVGFYVALFLTLLWVCLFTGEDMVRILISYAGYMFFMVLMAALVSFIYVNSFYPDLQATIVENFEKAKSEL